jgi:branched-chain amino acid transport system permease protein
MAEAQAMHHGEGSGVVKAPMEGKKIFLLLLLAVLFIFPVFQVVFDGLNYFLHIMLYTFMYIAMASGWNIIGGYAGYSSIGHNVFFAVGGYFSGAIFTYFGLSPFLTAPVAGLIAMVVGLLFGLISLRARGPAFLMSTLALALVVRILFDNWELVGGANGLSIPLLDLPQQYLKLPYYYGMLLTAMFAVYTSYRIKHSKFGLGLRAISQDETKAEVAGINTRMYKIIAFGISGIFAGMAGALWAYLLTYLRPSIFLELIIAADLILMSVLGGKGTVVGPVIGAILIIGFSEFSVSQFGYSELNIAVLGAFFLIVVLFFPQGIVGTLREHGKLPAILDWD